MIRLVYSNRTEELLAALAEVLRQRRAGGIGGPGAHPLDPVHLLVPNRNMEQHVRLGLAERLGVAANLRFRRLERFVGELVREADPLARLVDAEAMRGALLGIFHHEAALAAPELGPVRGYLEAPDEDGRALRAVQLATRLSRLFEEYAYSRPEMLVAWPTRAVLADGHLADLESWQRALWLAAVGSEGWLARHPPAVRDGAGASAGGRWVHLAEVIGGALPLPAGEPPLHVFGVSYVARAFQHLFDRLAATREVWLFTLNPCREFWEDVETPREHRRRLRRHRAALPAPEEDPYGLFSDTDNQPLQWWGRPGREHTRLLEELTECDFVERFVEPPAPGTLLEALQGDVLRRAATSEGAPHEPWATDGSLRILGAPDARREVEAVADAIWELMTAPDPSREPLRWSDVAVIVNAAARDRYLPQVQAVFGEYHGIPCTVGDLPLGGERRLAEAASLLLALPFGRTTRADLLRVMLHPAVRGRFPGVDPADWSALAAELGIFHGASHADLADTYVEEDLLSWDQGLRRLALGAFLTGARSGDERLWQGNGSEVRVADVTPGRLEAAAQFALLARSLLADGRRLRREHHPLRQWAAALRAMLSAYLQPAEDEEGDLARCLGAIAALDRADVGVGPVPGRVACELAREALAGLTTARSTAAGGGVVVSTLLPMRAIPFRAVFVLGLAEGEFPAANRRDALDLRAGGRMAGDVTPAERDRYLFLETLLSARERLCLSYVSRDERTGESLRPSSVVQELLEVLERSYVGRDGIARVQVEVPARRWDARYFPALALPADAGETTPAAAPAFTVAPDAEAAAAARLLGHEMRAALPGAPADPLPLLRAGLPAGEWEALSQFLHLPAVPAGTAATSAQGAAPADVPALSISTLRRFLECPLQTSAETVLGLERDEEHDPAEVEDESLRTQPGLATILLRTALARAARRSEDPRAALAAVSRPRELAGELPVGVLGALERELQGELLAGWHAVIGELRARGTGEWLRVGRAPEIDDSDGLLPPLRLLGPGGAPVCDLHGRSELLLAGRTVSLIADAGGSDDRKERKVRELRLALRGFLDHLLLVAADAAPASGRRIVLLRREDGAVRRVDIPLRPWQPEEARAYLAGLATDLLAGVHDYLLPCEAVFETYARVQDQAAALAPEAVAAAAIARITADRLPCSSRWGPVPDPAAYLPPAPERLATMLERRFAPFLGSLGPWIERTAAAPQGATA